MMRNLYYKGEHSGGFRRLSLFLLGLLVLTVTGCDPDKSDGTVKNSTALPIDDRLNLECANEGIYLETCVLDDSSNPYRNSFIKEFDPNGPDDQETKFDQVEELTPPGPEGAKSRFYFWATALARRSSGENQFFTAVALHELYTSGGGADGGSPNAREQAIKAYRSVLENYFGSVTFFSTCDFLNPSPPEPELFYSVIVSDLTGRNLVDPPGNTSFTKCDGTVVPVAALDTLFPDDDPVVSDFMAREAMGEWGFSYDEANGLVFVSNFP